MRICFVFANVTRLKEFRESIRTLHHLVINRVDRMTGSHFDFMFVLAGNNVRGNRFDQVIFVDPQVQVTHSHWVDNDLAWTLYPARIA